MTRFGIVLALFVLLGSCASSAEETTVAAGTALGEPTLTTPCFTIGAEVALPDNYIAADTSPSDGECWFVTQREGQDDTTVIAGELWKSTSGNDFEDFVGFLESGLSQGQEPDLLPLQLMNTGPSGRNLPVMERIEIDGPNRAAVLVHESDRRDGFHAMSAVVDVDTNRETDTTVIFMWGLVTDENNELMFDLINAMEFDSNFAPE